MKKSIRATAGPCGRNTALRSLAESQDGTRSRALSSATMARPRLQSDFFNGLSGFHRAEFDKEIHVAPAGLELIAKSRSERIQPDHAVAFAGFRDGVQLVSQNPCHRCHHYIRDAYAKTGRRSKYPEYLRTYCCPRTVRFSEISNGHGTNVSVAFPGSEGILPSTADSRGPGAGIPDVAWDGEKAIGP